MNSCDYGKLEKSIYQFISCVCLKPSCSKPKPWSVVDACDTWRHVQGMEEVMRQYSDPKKDADKMANPTKRVVNLTSSSVYIFIESYQKSGKSNQFISLHLHSNSSCCRTWNHTDFPKVQKTPHPSASNQPSATQAVALQPPAGHPCVSENGGYPLVN